LITELGIDNPLGT